MNVYIFMWRTVGFVVIISNLFCITNLLAEIVYSSSVTFVGLNLTSLNRTDLFEGKQYVRLCESRREEKE
jgi:hypothetical protein